MAAPWCKQCCVDEVFAKANVRSVNGAQPALDQVANELCSMLGLVASQFVTYSPENSLGSGLERPGPVKLNSVVNRVSQASISSSLAGLSRSQHSGGFSIDPRGSGLPTPTASTMEELLQLKREIEETSAAKRETLLRYEDELDMITDDLALRQKKRAIKELRGVIADLKTELEGVKTRIHTSGISGDLTGKIKEVQHLVDNLADRQDSTDKSVKILQDQVIELRAAREKDLHRIKELETQRALVEQRFRCVEDKQASSSEDTKAIRRNLDVLDNRIRVQSLILHGLDIDDPRKAVNDIFPPQLLEHIISMKPRGKKSNLNNRVPLAVVFASVDYCEQALDIIKSPKFRADHPFISASHDSSELARVGGTRMRAAEEALLNAYPDIKVKTKVVHLHGEKFLDSDFAADILVIGGKPFNIEEAVRANTAFEVNYSVSTKFEGRTYNAMKKRRGGRTGGNHPTAKRIAIEEQYDHGNVRGGRGGYGRSNFLRGAAPSRGATRGGLTNKPPPGSGTTTGGVDFFVGGHRNYGNKVRENVMSRNEHRARDSEPVRTHLLLNK